MSFLLTQGHEVVPLIRGRDWQSQKGEFEKSSFENFDAVIHLAGKNIASGRWTNKLKDEIFKSRARDTWFLAQILSRLDNPPKTLIVASACGIYGDRGDEILHDTSPPGEGFLSTVCKKWEEATQIVEEKGLRTIHTRFGLILSPDGGVLKKLLPLFKLGLGAIIGSGKQYVPWIALDDVLGAIEHILVNESIHGAVNFTSPNSETMESFCKKLAKALHRPLFFRIPTSLVKAGLGEMGKEMLLPSCNAMPDKLLESGYLFKYPRLEETLNNSFIRSSVKNSKIN